MAVREVVEDCWNSSAVVIAGMANSEWQEAIHVPTERCGESGHGCRFIVQRHLVVAFEGIDDGEKFHPCWDCSDSLEWRGRLEFGPDNEAV